MSNDNTTTVDDATGQDASVRSALAHGHVIDITTTGRRSGEPRRIEIVFHNIDGRIYITGSPRRETRAWLLNLRADPRLTFHLKSPVQADLAGTAREVTDDAERRAVVTWVVANAWNQQDVEAMARYSPIIEVSLAG